jgi:hypothetical protein
MKTINSLRSKLLTLTLALMASVSTFAYDFQSGYLFYNILPDRTVAVTSETYGIPYDYLPTSLVIPSEVSDYYGAKYQVSEIANGAFQGCDELESVIIPNTVKKIGMYAFTGCTKLIDISFPESLEDVMGGALYDCAWYDNQPDGLIYVGNLLYRYKGTAPAGAITIKEGTTAVLDLAFFKQPNITSVVLPESVTSVHMQAFGDCPNLESVTLPTWLSVIEDYTFQNCSKLQNINLPLGLKKIGEEAFAGCSSLTNLEWPLQLKSIGVHAFYNCNNLDGIENISPNIERIGTDAFRNTTWESKQTGGYLYIHNVFYAYTGEVTDSMHIEIKKGTTYISGGAVSRCAAKINEYSTENVVSKITIPNSVTEIEDGTFRHCRNLDTIICTSVEPPVISKNTFNLTLQKNKHVLLLPTEALDIYKWVGLLPYQAAPYWNNFTNVKPITDPHVYDPMYFEKDSIQYHITNDTLAPYEVEVTHWYGLDEWDMQGQNYPELITANIPVSVTYKGTTYLVTRVGKMAFYQASNLQRVSIGENVKVIDEAAFAVCDKLSDVVIGDGVDSILYRAFTGGHIETIDIPKNVKFIDSYSINNRSLKAINVHPDNAIYASEDGVLFNKNKNYLCLFPISKATSYVMPESVDTIGERAFMNVDPLKSLTFSSNLKHIKKEAFYSCMFLEKLVLPASLESIEERAFASCYSLHSITCLGTIPPKMSDYYSYSEQVFCSVPYEIPLFVPEESIEAYDTAPQWDRFEHIFPIGTSFYKTKWCDTWNMLVRTGSIYPPSSTPYRYQLAKDTVIGEHTYTAVVQKEINDALDAPHYVAAVRFTDDRKVYIYYDNAEYLLYDFNVQEGDELEVFAGINNYTSEIKTYKCTVTGVEQYACVGCPAAITLEVHNHPNDFREFYRETQWIEGVGDINGFLNGINHYVEMDGGGSEYLLCAYKGDELKYTGDLYEEYGCGDDAGQSPEDLFPTLWGLQRTSFTEYFDSGHQPESEPVLLQAGNIKEIGGKLYLDFGQYLREENGKIYIYSELLQKDFVLYDFTLELGDTLTTLNWDYNNPNSDGTISVVDYAVDCPIDTLIVTDISTVTLLDGKEYKKWIFNHGYFGYVESIGTLSGLFYELSQSCMAVPGCYMGDHLVCASRNGQLLYQMDEAEMERLGAECLCDYDRGPRKDNAKNGKIGGRPTPTQWNQLELDLREGENGNAILSAETFSYTLENDSIVTKGKTFYQLARQSTKDTATTKSFVGALHFGEDEDNRVYFLRDGVEYVLYDFTAEPGDTVEIFAGINNYPQDTTYTHVVTGKDTLENGACRMLLEVVFPDETTAENAEKVWLAGLGSIDGIVHNTATRTSNAHAAPARSANSETQTSVMLCAWREDSCLYTTNHPEYDTFGCVYNQDPTAVEDISTSQSSYQKIIREGQFLILHNGKTYSVMGIEL